MATLDVPDRRRSARAGLVVGGLVAVLIVGALLGVGGLKAIHKLHFSAPPSVAQPSAGYGLDAPTSAAVVGSDLFVANGLGDSVTEVNASSGTHLATISGASFGFDRPTAMLAVGHDLFVTNGADGVVTELDAGTRSPVRRISGFSDPLWSATWASTSTSSMGPARWPRCRWCREGKLVSPRNQFGFDPSGIASSRSDLFVTNSGANSITEINARTMAVVTQLTGPRYRFDRADRCGRPRTRLVGHEQHG